jgi:hypothetical protein
MRIQRILPTLKELHPARQLDATLSELDGGGLVRVPGVAVSPQPGAECCNPFRIECAPFSNAHAYGRSMSIGAAGVARLRRLIHHSFPTSTHALEFFHFS